MDTSHVVVVHSDPAIRHFAADSLAQDSLRVSLVSSGEDGLSLLERERAHVLVADLDMRGIGYEFVRQTATRQPLLKVVAIVDPANIDRASQRTERCPVEYLLKPITKASLRAAIHKALEGRAPATAPQSAKDEHPPARADRRAEPPDGSEAIVASSKAMREILDLVRRCARTDMSVLIQGEPDTGKELIAREIHRQSSRAAGPFVRVPCGALRDAELAEVLFGHEEQRRRRDGGEASAFLERTHGGTLFLENVSQLPFWAQLKLLYVLQSGGGLTGVGNEKAAACVRVIASTVADLHAAVAQRVFSPSLYYFLSVVQISVPPLRHRPQDIRALAETYLAIANSTRSRQGPRAACRFSEDALQCLLEYDWPGNAQQLASTVARAVLLAEEEEIGREKIAEAIGEAVPRSTSDTISVALAGGLKEIERAVIEAVIERCRGNKTAAARTLRLHRRTLYRILQEQLPAKPNAIPYPLTPSATIGGYDAASVCSQ